MKKIIYGFYIFFALFFINVVLFDYDAVSENYVKSISFLLLISFLANLSLLIKVAKQNIHDVSVLFLILSYLFLFGQVITSVMGFNTVLKWNVSDHYSEICKYHAGIYCIASLSCFSLGASKSTVSFTINRGAEIKYYRLYFIGIILFIVGLVCSLVRYLPLIYTTQLAGTYGSYADAEKIGVVSVLALMIVPGIVYMTHSNILSNICIKALTFTSIFCFLLVMIYSGSRKESIFSIIILMISYILKQKESISCRKMILYFFLGLCFLDLIFVIRETRFNLGEIVTSYFTSLISLDFITNIFGESLTEMGLTFYSVVNIFETVPEIFPYEYGETFARALLSIFPIGMIFGDFFSSADSTFVINKYVGIPVGASLIGDFYWNFGFLGGCFCSGLFGWFVSCVRNNLIANRISLPFYLSVTFILLIGVRANFFELIRPFVYLIVLIAFLSSVYTKYSGDSK